MLHGFGIPMLEISFDLVHRVVSIAYSILERCTKIETLSLIRIVKPIGLSRTWLRSQIWLLGPKFLYTFCIELFLVPI